MGLNATAGALGEDELGVGEVDNVGGTELGVEVAEGGAAVVVVVVDDEAHPEQMAPITAATASRAK